MDSKAYVDSAKRGKLLFFSILIGLSLFFIRGWEIIDIDSNRDLFSLAAAYFILTYIGLILLFKFQVNRRSLIFVLPQSSLFVASTVLFVMMFFFRDFDRLMDFFFLILIQITLVIITYSNFLMTNVFNVASFKRIPLVQVASTASFVASVVTIFLVSFAITSLKVSIPIMILTLFGMYTFTLIYHFVHILPDIVSVLRNAVVTALIAIIAHTPMLIYGPYMELSSLIPSAVVFSIIGMQMAENKSDNKGILFLQYFSVVIAAFLVNFLINHQ